MLSALSLWMKNLVSKLLSLCYVSGIVSLSLQLSPCLDMLHLEFPFTSCIEKCGQQPLCVLQMLKVQALNRQKTLFSNLIVVWMLFLNSYLTVTDFPQLSCLSNWFCILVKPVLVSIDGPTIFAWVVQ